MYQAYRPEIGHFAPRHGYFGGAFSVSRMSWIKPNFLWMMYRSGWGTKEGQEVTLAVRLRRNAFDEVLRRAVHSAFVPEVYPSHEAWQRAVSNSDVRLQWDPDHGPSGEPLERRAIQLGMRGEVLARYAREWLLGVEDVSDFVAEQREGVVAPYEHLVTMSAGPSYASPAEVGQPMVGGTVGRVVKSNHPGYTEGDHVVGYRGWQDHGLSDGQGVRKLDPNAAPLSFALGVLGMPGMTAYVALLDIGRPQPGETVVVSAASGAVGSVVGQIAKIKGCRAVGSRAATPSAAT